MAGVEEYGVEPIPAELRTVRWHDQFAILFTFNLSPLVFVIGALAVTVGDLPLWWAAGALALGAFVANLMLIIIARAGVDYGVPGQVAMRASFGQWGARGLTSPYRVVASVYWFAAQAFAGAFAITVILEALTGAELGLVPVALVLAGISAILAIVGFDAMRYFVRVVMPLVLIFTGVLVALYLTTDDPAFAVDHVLDSPAQSFTWLGFATFTTVFWAGQLTVVTNIADFTRYARSRWDMSIGVLGGSTLGTYVAAWVGAYAAIAIEESNPFAAASDLTDEAILLAILLLAALISTSAVNIMNLYTGGLSLVNTAPRLGRLGATTACAAIAVGLSAIPEIINDAQEWFVHLGNVAAPLTGVVFADFVIMKRQQLNVPQLFEPKGAYHYLGGLNVAAILAVGLTVPVYYAVPDTWLKVAWGVVVGSALYLAFIWIQGALFPSSRVEFTARRPTGATVVRTTERASVDS